jgi:MOSC domain-containing protein YiiM
MTDTANFEHVASTLPAGELAACAERILELPAGTFAGLSDSRPVAELGERLATRNLGLVRIADAATFSWPGAWIAIVEATGGRCRAMVFFGAPSGPLEELDAETLAEGCVVDGYLVAPLDLHRAHGADAYGYTDRAGAVVGIFTAASGEARCEAHDQRAVRAGRGLVGDRYADGTGTFSQPQRRGQDLTLIESESLDCLAADGLSVGMADARRNIVTRGINLNELIGHHFTIGAVTCYGSRLAEPCAHLERLTSRGVLRALVHRGGIRADVLADGEIRIGDTIHALPDQNVSA